MSDRTFLSRLTGSFSTPAAENPTVAMIEAAYRHHGIDARYLNCEVAAEDLADAVRGARAMGWLGFNCSIPHKVAVIEHLDAVAESARIIGAVNCVTIRDGRMTGENTDGKGFLAALETVADPKGARVALLGAGGAARAIAVELALAGAREIVVFNRSREAGESLAALIADETEAEATFLPWEGPAEIPEDADILVNATPIGLHPDSDAAPEVDFESLRSGTIVADVIPNPPRTRFLKAAEERGCTTLDGLGMLVNQGAAAIALWTGVEADTEPMRAALREIFGD